MSVSRTAQYVALYRALETTETRRLPLFEDRFAAGFLSSNLSLALRAARWPAGRRALEWYADKRAPGARTSAIGRTRFIDDVVGCAVAEGAGQLVILGAGYDCRAHRLAALRDIEVFEVDRAPTQAVKRARLAGTDAAELHPRLRYVAVDFGIDDMAKRLASSGFRRELRTVFVWEGVTNYLEQVAVERVLSFVGAAAPGSTLVMTYIHRGVLDGSARFDGADRLIASVRALGEPWRFGLAPSEVDGFLARFGLAMVEDLGADEYRRRYLGSRGRDLFGYGFYRVAVACVCDNDLTERATKDRGA